MLFNTPTFLFLFLPVVLTAYWAIPAHIPWKNLFLLIASVFFYAWGEHIYVVLLILSIVGNYAFGLAVAATRRQSRGRWVLGFSVLANLALMSAFKYGTQIGSGIDGLAKSLGFASIQAQPVHLPIGLSFYTFHALSYLIDIYRGRARVQRNPLTLALYIVMFPQLILGPIIRYRNISRQLVQRVVTAEGVAAGVGRFIVGLGKKVLIADILAQPVDRIFALNPAQLTAPLAWLAIAGFTLQIYFDFSSYSDMAIGLGRMFGFRYPENFNYPNIARSRADLFRRFHISFFAWMRDYLYRFLVPKGSTALRENVAILVVFGCAGLWHGASLTFIAWGLVNGILIVLERIWLGPRLVRWWRPLSHVYVLSFTLVSFCFFRATSFAQAVEFIGALAGFAQGNSLAQNLSRYLTPPVALALVAGVAGSMPFVPWLARQTARLRASRPGTMPIWLRAPLAVGGPLCLAGIFLLSLLFIAAQTHKPFIYFQF